MAGQHSRLAAIGCGWGVTATWNKMCAPPPQPMLAAALSLSGLNIWRKEYGP